MTGCFPENSGIGRKIIKYARLLYKKGLVAGADGNLSVRLDNDRVLVTASGVHKGLMGPEELIVVDNRGRQGAGTSKASSEVPMHLAIYEKIWDARAIIHAHAPWTTAASLKRDRLDLSILAEGRILFPEVKVVPFLPPGSVELAEAAARTAAENRVFILKAHGVVAWGKDLKEAFCLIEALEHNVKTMALRNYF